MKNSVLAVLYLFLPFLIFCIGFIRWYWQIPIVLFSFFAIYSYWKSDSFEVRGLHFNHKIILWIVAFVACFFLGIGGYWSQSIDWGAKNPIINDLSNHSWPLIIHPEEMSDSVLTAVGSESVAFVYYLFYYLPASVVGKMLGPHISQFCLYLWSSLGLYVILRLLLNYLIESHSYSVAKIAAVSFALFAFGGFDLIGHAGRVLYYWNPNIPLAEQHLGIMNLCEFWCNPYFTCYSSNWTSLYFCFNQCIPVWIIILLIVHNPKVSSIGFLSSFALLYSPWCAIGLLPIAVYFVLRNLALSISFVKAVFRCSNFLFPLLLLFVVGSYYLSNTSSVTEKGFFWNYLPIGTFLIKYVLFILLEIGIYIYVVRKGIRLNVILQGALCMLLIIPFYKMTPVNDFLLRASIPGLFILFVFWLKWCVDNWNSYSKYIIPIVCLCSLSFFQVLYYSFSETIMHRGAVTFFSEESFYSTSDNTIIKLGETQFFAHDYQETFFWKYLSK